MDNKNGETRATNVSGGGKKKIVFLVLLPVLTLSLVATICIRQGSRQKEETAELGVSSSAAVVKLLSDDNADSGETIIPEDELESSIENISTENTPGVETPQVDVEINDLSGY